MSLRINSEAPNFTADTTQGRINFHEWMGNGWAILFSHPKNFTPVCTTELGYMAGLKPEFDKRNCKIIGISVDSVADHEKWSRDIEETQGHAVNYPLIGDPELKVAKAYDMLPRGRGQHRGGPDGSGQRHRAIGLRDRAGQEGQGDAHLSDEQWAQLRRGPAAAGFLPTHRQAQGGHPGELEARAGRHHSAGGIGRRGQADVPRRVEGPEAVPADRPAATLGEPGCRR